MRTTKLLLTSVVLMAAFITAGATRTMMEAPAANASAALKYDVSIGQATTYLEQFHTVYSIWQISGTSNYEADIENCSTSIVYVSGGQIVNHQDSNGNCGGGGGDGK